MKKLRGILLSMTAVIVLLSLGGCGTKVNTKSPEKITESLIEAYTKTDEDAVKKCFGVDKKSGRNMGDRCDEAGCGRTQRRWEPFGCFMFAGP